MHISSKNVYHFSKDKDGALDLPATHIVKVNKYGMPYIWRKESEGLPKAERDRNYKDRRNSDKRQWRKDNPEIWKPQAKKYRSDHPEYFAQKQREYVARHNIKVDRNIANTYKRNRTRELRAIVLSHYSNGEMRCGCTGCDESYIEFLTLDHPEGGGSKHRKALGHPNSIAFYLWIIRNKFPPIFRVRCMNCNHSLGIYGYCPHQLEPKCVGVPIMARI